MQMNNILITIVTPVYGCSTSLIELYFRINEAMTLMDIKYELILVNDASPDNSWNTIVELANKSSNVKGIDLSRNFGQHYAISAGLEHANGDWIVVMDCDLQDKPEEIYKLYNKAIEGYEIVIGRRLIRKDPFLKKIYSSAYYRILSYFTDTKMDSSLGTFRIMSKKVVKS